MECIAMRDKNYASGPAPAPFNLLCYFSSLPLLSQWLKQSSTPSLQDRQGKALFLCGQVELPFQHIRASEQNGFSDKITAHF